MGITLEGPTRVAVLTFKPRKGRALDLDATTDEIFQLRVRQVGAKMAALSIDKPDLVGTAVMCRVHDLSSRRERQAASFDRHVKTIANQVAKRFGCSSRVEIETKAKPVPGFPQRRNLTDFEEKTVELCAILATRRKPWSLREARRSFEVLYVEHVLAAVGGDQRRAGRVLGVSFSSVKNKIRADYLRR